MNMALLTRRNRKNFPSFAWFAASAAILLGCLLAFAEPLVPPVPAPTNRTASDISPALSTVQRLTEEARRLRFSGAPGWRFAALKVIGQAVDLHGGVPLEDLRQEAIHALATADLDAEPWFAKGPLRLLRVNLSQDTYLAETKDGQIVERGLQDHRVVWQSSFESPASVQWLGQNPDQHRDLWLRNENRLETWDPSLRAVRSWSSAVSKIRSASFNWTGDQVALVQTDTLSGTAQLWFAPLRAMDQQRRARIQAPAIAAAWAPDNVRLAVLSDSPPQLLVYESGTELVSSTIPLPSRPHSVAWLPNARDVIIGTDGGLFFIDTSATVLHPFPGATNLVSVVIDESGTLALSSGIDGPVQLWDVAARQLLAAFPSGGNQWEWSADGRRAFLINNTTGTALLLSVASARDVVQFVPEDRIRTFPGKPEGLRLSEHAVELNTGSNALVQLPVPAPPTSALRSVNGRWVRIQLTDGRTQDWNLERLRDRLATLGIPW